MSVQSRDKPASRFATGAAVGAALATSVSAYVATRLLRRQPRPGTVAVRTTDVPNPMGAAAKTKPAAADRGSENKLGRVMRRIDAFQQRHRVISFPYAVVKKFGDDAAGNLAALIAYYGFLSLFPLLLALTTVLGTILGSHPDLQQRVLNSALAQFPVIGDQIRTNIHTLQGSGLALTVGVAGALWGGMGVMKAAGNAMDDLWEVPKRQRPNFLRAIIRAALLLVVLGGGVVITTILSGFGTSGSGGFVPLKILGILAAAIVDIALIWFGFRVLTVRDVAWRDLLPGAVVAGLGWLALQTIGGYYVTHQLTHATQTYGMFAVVIGLLSWIYLQAQITLFAAEINVVRLAHLWPRSLTGQLTAPDKRALAAYAEVEERRADEDVAVGFTDGERLTEGLAATDRTAATVDDRPAALAERQPV
jgi:YihY family inner membrane protein